MGIDTKTDTAEQYKSEHYQRTAEIERKVFYGRDIKDVYTQEAEFALTAADVKFEGDEKILDLACGEGHHADVLREKTGRNIDAFDTSKVLIQNATERERGITSSTRAKINYCIGSYGGLPLKPESESPTKYKLITILGTSFMYLPTPEAHQDALNDFCRLLKKGGKIAIQFRGRVRISDEENNKREESQREWCKKLGVSLDHKIADGENGKLGRYAKKGEEVPVLRDLNKGDGMYFYDAPLSDTGGLTPTINEYGDITKYVDSDGVERSSFGRAYINKDGSEENLGTTQIIDYMSVSAFPVLERMLEKSGFKNVKLMEDPKTISVDGSCRNFVVVAEK